MKKGEKIIIITIGLICFVLTYIMFMQFKSVEETNVTEIKIMTESELREKIVSWREKYEETYEKLKETNEKIAEYRESRVANQEASELLDKELLQAQILAGLTEVKGNGVVITLQDNEETEKIDSRDLLNLIRELKSAGAEAISINDQRIVNMTDIVDIRIIDGEENESLYIVINKVLDKEKVLLSPYVIKAIGDPKYLESALTVKTVGFMDQYSKNATLERQNNIRIPKYDKEIKLRYTKDQKGEK